MNNPLETGHFGLRRHTVDSQHMICAAMQQAFLDHRIDCPPREKLLSIVGLSLAEGF